MSEKSVVRSSSLSAWLKLLVGMLLIAFLFYSVDAAAVIKAVVSADSAPLLLGLGVYLALGFLEGIRLQICMQRYELTFVQSQLLHFAGVFFSNLLPGNMGAEFFKSWYFHRYHGEVVEGVALLGLLRLVATATTAVLVALYFVFSPDVHDLVARAKVDEFPVRVAALIGLAGVLIILGVARHRRLRAKIAAVISRAGAAYRALGVAAISWIVVLSLVINVLRAGTFLFAAAAVNIDISPLESLLLMGGAVLATALPISFAGLGVREGAIAGLLVLLGAAAAPALAAAVIVRMYMVVTAILGWGSYTILMYRAKDRKVFDKGEE